MIQVTPQMRILVAVEPTDFRRGIDGLARVCKDVLQHDPFSGWVFVFRNRPATALKILVYDGQGFWLCHKRLSSGRFRWWPTQGTTDQADPGRPGEPTTATRQRVPQRCPARSALASARTLAAHQLQVLLAAGDPEATHAAPAWRPITPGR
jgi:transposase